MLSGHLSRCLTWTATAILASACSAQVMQYPGTMPDGHRVHFPGAFRHDPHGPQTGPNTPAPAPEPKPAAGHPEPVPSRPALAAVPPSLLNQPAEPAKVTLADGLLAVHANNSSLSAILHNLVSSSGMSIDGLNQDQRVFGTYGPGNPRDVLSTLLDGAGYNVLMVGSTETGTPRQLILTARSDAPLSTPRPTSDTSANQQDQDDEPVNNYPADPAPPPARMAPPQPTTPGAVKTPAQILQELQQLRQQQQQQPPPQ